MATLFGILEIGAKGIFAQQRSINTTGHNIANATTPGYSRQRANLVSANPLLVRPGPLGTGVDVINVSRFRDDFLEAQTRNQLSLLGFFEASREGYDQLQVILNEPLTAVASALDNPTEVGINDLLNRVFGAFQELSLEPESTASRTSLVQTAVTATETFNLIDQQASQYRDDLDDTIVLKVDEINLLLDQLVALNQRVAQVEVDDVSSANDFRDQRDQLLSELASLVPVRTVENPNGTLNISILGVNVISGSVLTTHLEAVRTPGDPNAHHSVVFERERSRVLNDLFPSGELGALFNLRDNVVPQFQQRVDALASALIEQVNRVHSGGSGLIFFEELTGLNTVTSSTTALENAGLPGTISAGQFTIVLEDGNGNETGRYTIAVDPATDSLNDLATAIDAADGTPAGGDLSAAVVNGQLEITAASGQVFRFEGDSSGALAALGLNTFFTGTDAGTMGVVQAIIDSPGLIAHSTNGAPGNVDNAIAIAQLDSALVLNNNSTTFADYDRSTLAILGVEARRVTELENNTGLLVQELQNRQESISGVSLDEEAVNLIRFQQAFNGSARFITALDQLIDTVVNRMGLVGL